MDVFSLEGDGGEQLFITQNSSNAQKVVEVANFELGDGDGNFFNFDYVKQSEVHCSAYLDISDDEIDVFCSSQVQQMQKEQNNR